MSNIERRRFPQPKPATDQADVDVAAWEAKLKAVDPSLMTQDEEERGVHFGSEGAEDIIEVPLDKLGAKEAKIAAAIANEPGNELYQIPGNQEELHRAIEQLFREARKAGYEAPKLGVHASCVSGDPCVTVRLPDKHPKAGIVLHLPTTRLADFSVDELTAHFGERNIGVIVKPELS